MNGRPLDFALACVSAIRHDHDIHDQMTLTEMSEICTEILEEVGLPGGRSCTRQNLSLIEHKALRRIRAKLYCNPQLNQELHERGSLRN